MTDTPACSPDLPAALADLTFRAGVRPRFTPEQLAELSAAAGLPPELQDALGGAGVSPLALKMGIVFTELTAERAVATMPVAGNEQPVGLLHGGAHLVLAETLGSVAAKVAAGRDHNVVGIEIGATHHAAARAGTVTGTATAVHVGRTLITHEVVMTGEDGRRLSTARITNLVLARQG
ncbi:hotdog fold thioesterase [Micrococcus sp. 2A]|uniref:hotdog fold thioesterase n=1 Tax=unclassified Micrococcus TaxID=2620948 RepID=UPI002605A5FC|nr:hotdog fold thioesterase [Micrococcus sp. M4NT]MDX2340909.1 hotdog fold thioesterase [Micrococcus sp. M4NT]